MFIRDRCEIVNWNVRGCLENGKVQLYLFLRIRVIQRVIKVIIEKIDQINVTGESN